MFEYLRRVQYYETDKMGIVHHSNYIRWFEEARLALMDSVGCPYKTIEDMGFICPVLSVSCNYKKSVTFGGDVKINVGLKDFGNVKHSFFYTVTDPEGGVLYTTGESSHCFLNDRGRVVSMKKKNPGLCCVFESLLENNPQKPE